MHQKIFIAKQALVSSLLLAANNLQVHSHRRAANLRSNAVTQIILPDIQGSDTRTIVLSKTAMNGYKIINAIHKRETYNHRMPFESQLALLKSKTVWCTTASSWFKRKLLVFFGAIRNHNGHRGITPVRILAELDGADRIPDWVFIKILLRLGTMDNWTQNQ